jgi:tRNA threonylcarbamoyladenosine biosynthesis protein TsaE
MARDAPAPLLVGPPVVAAPVAAMAPGPADMARLGAALASLLQPGDTVLLGGELGAGKTTFTKGLAAALGITEPVTSPTFVLVRSYKTRAGWDLLHADVWRLKQLQEVIDLAIPELQEEGAAAVVEWGELAAPALAPDCLHVEISFEADGQPATSGHDGAGAPRDSGEAGDRSPRRLVLRALGPSWESRMAPLAARWAEQD